MAGEGSILRVVVVFLALLLLATLITIGCLGYSLMKSKPEIPELYVIPKESISSVIQFSQGQQETYQSYMDSLNAYLEVYSDKNQEAEGLVDCTSKEENDSGFSCKFPLSKLGPGCTAINHYGLDEGQPCVLLQMQKVLAYDDYSLCNETRPRELRLLDVKTTPGFIKVTCQGDDYVGKDNIGPVKFWPHGGFDLMYFPYLNQKNYLPPLVMVQFQRIRPGVVVNVKCKLWSDGIRHTQYEGGTVRFSIMMD